MGPINRQNTKLQIIPGVILFLLCTSTRRERYSFDGILATLNQLREVIQSLETHNVTASGCHCYVTIDYRTSPACKISLIKRTRFCWLSMSTPSHLNQHWHGQMT